jgi:hypothetical protein
MPLTGTLTINRRTYTTTGSVTPYVVAAVTVSSWLKAFAQRPWRLIPQPLVWLGFGARAFGLAFEEIKTPTE